jgi:hypothetical protein
MAFIRAWDFIQPPAPVLRGAWRVIKAMESKLPVVAAKHRCQLLAIQIRSGHQLGKSR